MTARHHGLISAQPPEPKDQSLPIAPRCHLPLSLSFMMPRAFITIFSKRCSEVPFFILRIKYFSKAILARWTHLPSENQFTLRGGIRGSATKQAPVSPKSARQTAFQVALALGSLPFSSSRMLFAVAVTMDSIM